MAQCSTISDATEHRRKQCFVVTVDTRLFLYVYKQTNEFCVLHETVETANKHIIFLLTGISRIFRAIFYRSLAVSCSSKGVLS